MGRHKLSRRRRGRRRGGGARRGFGQLHHHECIQSSGGIGYTWEHQAHSTTGARCRCARCIGPAADWAALGRGDGPRRHRRPVEVDLPADEGQIARRYDADMPSGRRWRDRSRRAAGRPDGWVVTICARGPPPPWAGRPAAREAVIAEEMKHAGCAPPALLIGAWVVPALVS